MVNSFCDPINSLGKLKRNGLKTLQINMGKLCHQSCTHCHVDAGPDRKEIMGRDVMNKIASFVGNNQLDKIDITGGAPELNPGFEYLIELLSHYNPRLLLRTNLTVMFEPNHEHLPEFYQKHKLELVGSLPCYLAENVDKQRGNGVFAKSIRALKLLNKLGYGREGSALVLNLVYNPLGPYLPPPQDELEIDYKRELSSRYGIAFNHLYTITNIPINRFKRCLQAEGQYEDYLDLLKSNFNPATMSKLMCLEQVSVGWDGRLYDCDFNQMLELDLIQDTAYYIDQVSAQQLVGLGIRVGPHCYGCVAGGGSSCCGSLL